MIEVELPDGRIVEFPEGTSPDVIQSTTKKILGVQKPRTPDAFDRQLMEDAKINPFAKVGAEVLGGMTGLMRGGANIVGSVFGKSKLGQEIWPTEALDKGSAAYFAGELLDPVSWVTGSKAMQMAGKIPQVAKFGKMAPVVQGAIGGAGAGAVTGGLSEEGSAGTGAVFGGVVGGGIPLVGKGVQKLAEIAAPLTKKGAQVAGGRMMNEVVGESYDDVLKALKSYNTQFAEPTVAQATAKLQNPKIAAMEAIVNARNSAPGTKRLFEQRAERADLLGSFAGTDDEIARMLDARKTAMTARIGQVAEDANTARAAREAAVMPQVYEWVDDLGMLHRGITPPSKGASAGSSVTRVTESLPKDAFGFPAQPKIAGTDAAGMPKYELPGTIRTKSTTPQQSVSGMRVTRSPGEIPSVPALESLKQNPAFRAAMADARRRAANMKGLPDSGFTADEIADILKDPSKSFKGLQLMKAAIDDRFADPSNTASALSKIDDRALSQLKTAFLGASEQAAPGWGAARKKFGEESNAIFQKQVGKSMLQKLQAPLGEKETPSTLARALEKETGLIKEAGGFTREGLDTQLSPVNAARVAKVIGQLDIDTSLYELAKRGVRDEKVVSVTGEKIELPNLMNQSVAITNGVIRRVFGAGQIKTLRELAVTMQDPKMMALMMEKATAKEKNALKFMENAMKYYSPYAAAQAGSAE